MVPIIVASDPISMRGTSGHVSACVLAPTSLAACERKHNTYVILHIPYKLCTTRF